MASKRVSSGGIAVGYDIAGALAAAGVLPWHLRAKRLRRMPHLFCRVLELPVCAESPVQVEESPSYFTFKVLLPPPLPEQDHVHAQVIHIVPGVTKVCVTGAHIATALLDELDIPLWRFRLPPSSLPEASTAACDSDGLLVLTVPKDPSSPPSLLPHYQVTLVETPPPSLDADDGSVTHIDGALHESSPTCAGDGYTSLLDFKSLSTSVDQDETGDVRVRDPHTSVDNDETADAHNPHNSRSFDVKRDDDCISGMNHEDVMRTDCATNISKCVQIDGGNREHGEAGADVEV